MKHEKLRLDVMLVQRGLFPSREAARRAIMAGMVTKNGQVYDKPGLQVLASEQFDVHQAEHQYVSRGGLKLEQALRQFDVSLADKVVLDVGASTGGFTDCALQNGATHVFAVDVGYGQLAWKLRNDPRVTVMERTNFRHVDKDVFQPQPEVAVMDVSFISTKLLLPKIQEVLKSDGSIISLIKPQFEAGRERVGKGGIVRDPNVHLDVLQTQLEFVYMHDMVCGGLDISPITGGDGNIEFLGWWKAPHPGDDSLEAWLEVAKELVRKAWRDLRGVEVLS